MPRTPRLTWGDACCGQQTKEPHDVHWIGAAKAVHIMDWSITTAAHLLWDFVHFLTPPLGLVSKLDLRNWNWMVSSVPGPGQITWWIVMNKKIPQRFETSFARSKQSLLIHGSKPLTGAKFRISQRQKCFSELKISNPRIFVHIEWSEEKFLKGSVGHQIKLWFRKRLQMTDLLLMQLASYRCMLTRKTKISTLCLDRFYLLAKFCC